MKPRREFVFHRWAKEKQERNLAQWKKYGPAIIKVMERIEKLEAKA